MSLCFFVSQLNYYTSIYYLQSNIDADSGTDDDEYDDPENN